MDQQFFESQIERLRTQWRNHYGSERVAAMWRMFKDVRNEIFQDAISQLLVNQNHAPLAADLSREVELCKNREMQARSYGFGTANIAAAIARAKSKTTADREFVARCVETIKKKATGQFTEEQFSQACDVLDQAAEAFMAK